MPPCGLTTLVLLAVAVVVALAVAMLDDVQLKQREEAKGGSFVSQAGEINESESLR